MKTVNKMATTVALLLAVALVPQRSVGQNRYTLPQITPKSPNAASLGKYGEVPVSLSNGMANISVPLVAVKSGSVNLSIGLSYHNNGLKVDEIPSWVGLGWDLSGAGGVINYEQRGNPDFDEGMTGLFTSPTAKQKLGKYLRNQMTVAEKYTYLEEVIDGNAIDAQYDLYHYNFMGQTGSFYFDSMQRIVQVPQGDLSIVRANEGFTITDAAGNQYIFDRAEQGTMGPAVVSGMETRKSFNESSSFLLGRIVTLEGRLITFNYAQYPANGTMAYQKQGSQLVFYPIPAFAECPGGSNFNQYGTAVTTKNYLLQSIVFDGGSIVFETTAGGREDIKKLTGSNTQWVPGLAKVKLLDAQGATVEEYRLRQSYFGTNDRLRLDEVVRCHPATGDTSGAERWQFAYYGQNEAYFPPFISKSKDHWGYYNGANNGNALPAANYGALIFGWRTDLNGYVGANRAANGAMSQAGLLQTVTYPTGGQTLLEYEPNRVVYPGYQQINNPFLFQNVQQSIPFGALVSVDTDNGPPVVTGSFTIAGPGATPVRLVATRESNPTSFINSVVTVTTQGGQDLLGLFACQPNTTLCHVDKTVDLDPGTYNYSVYKNVDSEFNPDGGKAVLQVLAPVATVPQPVPMQVGGHRVRSLQTTDGLGNITIKRYGYNDSLNSVGLSTPYYISKTHIRRNRVTGGGGTIFCQDCGQETKIHDESVVPMAGPSISYGRVTEYTDNDGANGQTDYMFGGSVNLSLNGTQPYVSPFMATWRSGLPVQKTVYKRQGTQLIPLREENSTYQSSDPQRVTWGVKADYWASCEEQGPDNRVVSETRENYQTERFYLAGTNVSEYDTTGTMTNQVSNEHASARHTQLTQTQKTGSNGELLIGRTQYSFDYDTLACTEPLAQGLRNLLRSHVLAPVEQLAIKSVGGQPYITGGTLLTYRPNSPVLNKVYELELAEPLPLANFTSSHINTAGAFVYDGRYRERAIFAAYDGYGNVLEERYANNKPQSYLWDYTGQYMTAKCANAAQADVAATSFEADGKGNFTYSGLPVADAGAPTGGRVYPLAAGNIAKALDAGKNYIVSFWAKGSASVSGGSLYRTGGTLKGYTYYEYSVNNMAALTISGSGTVDELRLYPKNAQMATYTYQPLVGITSESDANGLITYYAYDAFGRLQYIRDMNGKVLKVMAYGLRKNVAD